MAPTSSRPAPSAFMNCRSSRRSTVWRRRCPALPCARPGTCTNTARRVSRWRRLLVAEDGTIIAGHGRVLAARKLRITDVPVMIASDWTDAQKRAYAIADNKLTLNGGWDEELLGLELGELEVLRFDLDLIGFTESEREAL